MLVVLVPAVTAAVLTTLLVVRVRVALRRRRRYNG